MDFARLFGPQILCRTACLWDPNLFKNWILVDKLLIEWLLLYEWPIFLTRLLWWRIYFPLFRRSIFVLWGSHLCGNSFPLLNLRLDSIPLAGCAVSHYGPRGKHGACLIHQYVVSESFAELIRLEEKVVAVLELAEEVWPSQPFRGEGVSRVAVRGQKPWRSRKEVGVDSQLCKLSQDVRIRWVQSEKFLEVCII